MSVPLCMTNTFELPKLRDSFWFDFTSCADGPVLGWRAGFALGAVLAAAIVVVRRHVPESPRWLMAHGRVDEARRIVEQIEAEVVSQHGPLSVVIDVADREHRAPPSVRQMLDALLESARARIGAGEGFYALEFLNRASAVAPKDWRPWSLMGVASTLPLLFL